MLFHIFGSSCSGKTTSLNLLRQQGIERLAIHDFDEIGVPPDADTRWRQRSNERWIDQALAYQREGVDLFLAGQTPHGELLAAPSAPMLSGVASCLLHCSADEMKARLAAREAAGIGSSHGKWEDLLNWAEWMRNHARDPQWHPEVIAGPSLSPEMQWERWSDWQSGDPRWRVNVIDTSDTSVGQVVDALAEWIGRERAAT